MNRYNIYPSLIDAFNFMRSAEDQATAEADFLAKVNRVPQPYSEAAGRGTALNNIVDAAIQAGDPDFFECVKVNADGLVPATDGVKTYYFAPDLVQSLADQFRGSLCQTYAEAPIMTDFGPVKLYGYADYIRGDEIIDLKTTGNYTPYKYRDYAQRFVYPYIFATSNYLASVECFTFHAVEFSNDGKTKQRREVYTDTIEECRQTIRHHLDAYLLPWLEAHREQITDKKIFNIK